MTLQALRTEHEEIEGEFDENVCFSEINDERFIYLIHNVYISDFTLDEDQMMVVYDEDEEDDEYAIIHNTGMINCAIGMSSLSFKILSSSNAQDL